MSRHRRWATSWHPVCVLAGEMPALARAALHVPVLRIWARDWLCAHGHIAPPQAPPRWDDDGAAGDRGPRRPRPSLPSLTVALDEPA